MTTPILETQRLILRPVRLEDAAAIQRYFPHWEIVENLSTRVPWPYPDDGAAYFLSSIALPAMDAGENFIWAITDKTRTAGLADECIGLVDLSKEPDEHGQRGFWLALPFHGRGYMTEAIYAVQDYIFGNRILDRMIITTAANNTASNRIKEKTGGKLTGRKTGDYVGGQREILVWEIDGADWCAARNITRRP